jgi:3-oxoacyl-[acyl-carrier-protein] synthase-1
MNGVDVVGAGARTPVGMTAAASAAAVRAGISRARTYPFITANGEPITVASDPCLGPDLEGRERMLPLVESVLDEVVSAFETNALGQVTVLLVLPEARPGFSDHDAEWVVAGVRACLSSWNLPARVSVGGRGHAGGIQALGQAIVESGRNSDALFIIVGVDSYHHRHTFVWLEGQRRLTEPGVRSGFMPGEGAGCLVLASPAWRKVRQVPRLAVVRSACTAKETLLRDSETGSLGVGLSQAVTAAVAAAGLRLPEEAADAEYIDINGERYRSEEFGFLAMRVPNAFRSFNYVAPADCWGDVGAAFVPLAAVLAVRSFARGYARGPRAVVLAGSDSGLRGATWIEDVSAKAEKGVPAR